MKIRHTILEVARSAQVSVATVSRVAAGDTHVSPEVAHRVRKAAATLGLQFQHRQTAPACLSPV